MSITAKSVVLDIQADWLGGWVGLRSVEFKLSGSLVTVAQADISCYATTSDPVHNPEFAFDTGLSKTGSSINNSWLAYFLEAYNQRLICVFDTPIEFDEIVINNYHLSGVETDRGARLVKIYVSSDAITSTVYGESIANSFLIFDGQFDEHVASDVADDKTLAITEPPTILSLPPLNSTGDLSADVSVGLSLPALESIGDLSADVSISLSLPPLESIGTVLADIVATLSLSLPPLESTGTLSGDLSIDLVLPPLESAGGLSVGSIAVLSYKDPSILFLFTLTGAADGLDDVQIPIKSFQARHRSGKPTYLSVTIPGTDYSQEISDRPSGEMVIRLAKVHQGAIYHSEEILRVSLEEIRPDDGGRSKSITLTGHGTTTYSAKTVNLQDVTYRTGSAGKLRFRLATPDIFLRPGDTAVYEADSILVDTISYTVGEGRQTMEVAE